MLVLALLAGCADPLRVPPEGLPDLYAAVVADPDLVYADAEGCVRVHQIWKAQVRAVHKTARESPPNRVRALAEDAYLPFESFWRGYLGDEGDFRRWAQRFDLAGDPRRRIPMEADPAELIAGAVARMEALTGRRGCADWYVVHGPGGPHAQRLSGAGGPVTVCRCSGP